MSFLDGLCEQNWNGNQTARRTIVYNVLLQQLELVGKAPQKTNTSRTCTNERMSITTISIYRL
jgi:hypothetical protein